jgi:hypothetical protein
MGILLPTDSAPFNIDGVYGALSADNMDVLSKQYDAKIEHVTGLYEYYKVAVDYKGVRFNWVSDNADMSASVLYAESIEGETNVDPSEIPGLTLDSPKVSDKLETVSSVVRKDGGYRVEAMYDSVIQIIDERVKRTQANAESIAAQIDQLNAVPATDVKVTQDAALTKLLSYPAWRATYTTGANEDTRTNMDIYVQTDDMDFRFHTSTPSESYIEYKKTIESWIQALEFTQS